MLRFLELQNVSKLALLFKEDVSQKTENIVYSEVLLPN